MKSYPYKSLSIFHFAQEIESFRDRKKTNCLIFGNFGAMNCGDEAILAGEIAEINKLAPHIKITVVSRYPDRVKSVHGNKLTAVATRQISKVISAVIKSDIVIFGGGGLICKIRSGLRGQLFQIYFMSFFLLLPLVLQKKVYALGIGVYSNASQLSLFLATILLKKVQKVTVRDAHSLRLLQTRGVEATLNKDNSYLMELNPKRKRLTSTNLNVGLALRVPFTHIEQKILTTSIVKLINKHFANCTFWFFELDRQSIKDGDHFITKDINRKVTKQARQKIKIYTFEKNTHPKKIFSDLGKMDAIVAMRLHSMIFADRQGVPLFCVPYDIKCVSFIESIQSSGSRITKDMYPKLNKFIENLSKKSK